MRVNPRRHRPAPPPQAPRPRPARKLIDPATITPLIEGLQRRQIARDQQVADAVLSHLRDGGFLRDRRTAVTLKQVIYGDDGRIAGIVEQPPAEIVETMP